MEHQRAIHDYLLGFVKAANLTNPGTLAQQLVILAEGAIVVAMMQSDAGAAMQAKTVAAILVAQH